MPETRLSIAVLDEVTAAVPDDGHRPAQEDVAVPVHDERLTRSQRQVAPSQRRVHYAVEPRVTDNPMRLPSFNATCPHVRDQIIPMNGGRFNVDQYLRVLRAKAELDVSVVMALTVRAD